MPPGRITSATLVLSLLLAVVAPGVGLLWLLLLVPATRLSTFLDRRAASTTALRQR